MKLKMRSSILAMFCILFALQAHADRAGKIGGDGLTTCGDYLQDRKNGIKDGMYADWVLGLISSYNLYGSKSQVETLPSQSTIVAYLDKHCRDKPLDTVIQGAIGLIKDLGGMK